MTPARKEYLSGGTLEEIKEYLALTENITPAEIEALKNDRRKGAQALLALYYKKREKVRAEEELLHKLSTKEEALRKKGYTFIAGVDEAGRGPLAGPVVAAAVIIDPRQDSSCWRGINDSKQLTPQKREQLYNTVVRKAKTFAVGVVSASLIDKINIYRASLEAMRLAVLQLWPRPNFVLSDGFSIPGLEIPQEAVKHGDALCLSIAAASIVAKVTRDRIMLSYEKLYPGYGLAENKGYPTVEHREAISLLGISPVHRRSFKCE